MGSERRTINFQYAKQLENQQAQNDWQSAENQIDREWQASEWERQFMVQMNKQLEQWREQLGLQNEADFEKWKKQFDLENQWNDPSSQIQRLMSAGINPSAAASQFLSSGETSAPIGGSSSPSGSGGASGGSVGSHSVSPSLISNPNYSTDAALFSSVAQLGDSLGKMANSGVQAYSTARKIEPEIKKTLAEADAKREETALTKIHSDIERMFGKSKAAVSLQKDVVQSYNLYMDGKYKEASAKLSAAHEALTSEQTNLLKAEAPDLVANLKLLGELYQSETKVNLEDVLYKKSEEVKNYSVAHLNEAYKQTEDDLRKGKVSGQTLLNGISAIDFGLRSNSLDRDNKTQQEQIFKILQECKRSGYITEKELNAARMSIRDNNWQETEKYLNLIRGAISSGTNMVSPLKIK